MPVAGAALTKVGFHPLADLAAAVMAMAVMALQTLVAVVVVLA